MKKQVVWQDYEDYAREYATHSFLDDIYSYSEQISSGIDRDDLDDDYDDTEEVYNIGYTAGRCAKSLWITPRLRYHYEFIRTYGGWVGHVNFDISPEKAAKIKKLPGVEALVIISRYRFIVGIGRLFKSSEVKNLIRQELEQNGRRQVDN